MTTATTNRTTRIDVSKEFREAVFSPAKDDLTTGGKILVNTRSTKSQLLSAAVIVSIPMGFVFFLALRQGDAAGTQVFLFFLAMGILVAINFINNYRARTLLTSGGITQQVRWPLPGKSLNWQDVVRVDYENTNYGANKSLIFTGRNRQNIKLNLYSGGLKDLVDYMRRYLDLETYVNVLWLINLVRQEYNPQAYDEEQAERTPSEVEKTKQVIKAHNERALKTSAVAIRWLLGVALPGNLALLALMQWKKLDLFILSIISTLLVGFAFYASTRHPGTNRDKTIRWALFVLISSGLLAADIFVARSIL